MKTVLPMLQALLLIGAVHSAGSVGNLPPGFDRDRYIITYETEAGKAAIAEAASKVHLDLPNLRAVAATVPEGRVAGLLRNPLIASIEPDKPRFPVGNVDPSSSLRGDGNRRLPETVPYGITMVQADQVAHAVANRKTICIMDSGYALGHPDLPSTAADVNGYSTEWSQDGCRHGTQ
jgi:serine protease